MELETRTLEIRAVDPEKRTIRGVAVPWDQDANIGGGFMPYTERFEKGAITTPEDTGVKFFDVHRQAVGVVRSGEDTEVGHEIVAHISQTTAGDDVLTLARDGVYGHLSIGFEPMEHRLEVNEAEGTETVVRTKVLLREVSAVPFPAYAGAVLSEVRAASSNITTEPTEGASKMTPEEIQAAVDAAVQAATTELRETNTELERRMDTIGTQGRPGAVQLQHRSMAELVKGLATGQTTDQDVEAMNRAFGEDLEERAYTGATTVDANVRPSWVQRALKLVDEKRDNLNLWSKAPLPATGMTVDYPKVESTTGTVDEQLAQGDDLPYMEVVIGDDSAPVRTYGGYAQLSRQAIERSDLPYLQKVLDYMAIQYAKRTNNVVRSILTGATGTGTAALATVDAKGWIDLAIDMAAAIHTDSMGLEMEFIVFSLPAFKALADIVDDAGRPLFVVNGGGGSGVNTIGQANLRNLSINVAGFPGVVDLGLTGTDVYGAASDAITVMESPGAPYRLEDQNIRNLTKDFSLYGYLATTLNDPKGIVKADTTPGV